MAYTTKDELRKIEGITNICDRIIEELDEEYPWQSTIRFLVERIKNEYGDLYKTNHILLIDFYQLCLFLRL